MSSASHIRLLVLDIDGVLTDGRVYLDERGGETKSLHYRDLDALAEARRQGLQLALLTGESSPMVALLAEKLGITHVVAGQKDKLAGITGIASELGIALSQTAYMGDARRDIPALAAVGRAFCPADAHHAVLAAGFTIVPRPGGGGAVEEAVAILLEGHREP